MELLIAAFFVCELAESQVRNHYVRERDKDWSCTPNTTTLETRAFQKLRWRNIQSVSDSDEVEDGQIALASFDAAHVTSIDSGEKGKRFLRDAKLQPTSTDRRANRGQMSCVVPFARYPLHPMMVAV